MVGILGKKLGMTQVFAEDGRAYPVTVVEAGPCCVVQVKNNDKDGYEAVKVGFLEVKEKKMKCSSCHNSHGSENSNLKKMRLNSKTARWVNAWLLLLPASVLMIAFTHYPIVGGIFLKRRRSKS